MIMITKHNNDSRITTITILKISQQLCPCYHTPPIANETLTPPPPHHSDCPKRYITITISVPRIEKRARQTTAIDVITRLLNTSFSNGRRRDQQTWPTLHSTANGLRLCVRKGRLECHCEGVRCRQDALGIWCQLGSCFFSSPFLSLFFFYIYSSYFFFFLIFFLFFF